MSVTATASRKAGAIQPVQVRPVEADRLQPLARNRSGVKEWNIGDLHQHDRPAVIPRALATAG